MNEIFYYSREFNLWWKKSQSCRFTAGSKLLCSVYPKQLNEVSSFILSNCRKNIQANKSRITSSNQKTIIAPAGRTEGGLFRSVKNKKNLKSVLFDWKNWIGLDSFDSFYYRTVYKYALYSHLGFLSAFSLKNIVSNSVSSNFSIESAKLHKKCVNILGAYVFKYWLI